jgi:hypothetical protein
MSGQRSTGGVLGAADGDGLQNLARIGLISYGVIHLILAWLALQLAWGVGGGGESANESGALATLAESPIGKPLLWVVGIGLIALAVWQALEVLRWRSGWSASGDTRNTAVKRSGKAVAKAIIYAALAVLAFRVATGSSGGGGSQQQTVAGVFGWPGGRWLVGAAGLVVVGVGIYHVYKGVTKHFLKEIDLAQASSSTTRLVTRLGQVGYPGKGIALGVVGGLLVWSAVTFDPAKASGLDGALRTILDAPFGRLLLTLVALGIAAFGAYLFVRARYPERT